MSAIRWITGAVVLISIITISNGVWAQSGVPGSQITIAQERLCPVVDGEPFFALGACGIPEDQMQVAAEAGFNLAIRWSASGQLKNQILEEDEAAKQALREYLDAAQAAGMLAIDSPVFLNAKAPSSYADPQFHEKFAQFLESPLPFIIDSVKDHPALFGYYGPDEPGEEQHADCAAYSEVIREHDPNHPLFFLFSGGVPQWPEVYDIAGRDYYPTQGRATVISVLRAAEGSAETAHSQKVPYWHMPLMHVSSASRMRTISPGRQQAQVYLAVIGGANGIVWWRWPPGHVDNWAAIKKLLSELGKLSPVLTEPPAPTHVRHTPERLRDTVQLRAIQRKDITFLIAANAAERAATARITLPEEVGPRAPVWFEDRVMEITGGAFTDHFEPLDRHVYEIHGQWPSDREIGLEVTLEDPGAEEPVRVSKPLEENLLLDPGFEGDAYWTFRRERDPDSTIAWSFDEDSKVSGRRSAVIEVPEAGPAGTLMGPWVELKAGSRYTFGGWARSETADNALVYVRMAGGLEVMRSTSMQIDSFGPWRQYSTVFSVDSDVRAMPEVHFYHGAGKVWLDDFFLVEAPRDCPNMIVNGGFEGATYYRGSPRWWWDVYGIMEPGHIGGPDALWGLAPEDAYEGERCLRMIATRAEDPSQHPLAQQMLAPGTVLRAGHSYVLSAHLKASRPDLPAATLVGGWGQYHRFAVGDTWERYSFVAKPEADVTQPFVRFDVLGEGTLWIDAVQFEEGTEPTEYREWSE